MSDLEFNLQPSKIFIVGLTVVLVISLISIIYLPLSLLIKLLLLLPLGIYLGYIIWRDGLLRSKDSVVKVRRNMDGTWHLHTNTDANPAILLGDSTVTRAVIVLRFRLQQKIWPISCLIFYDSLSPERYQQLLLAIRTY